MDTSFESQRNLLLDSLKNLNTNDFQSADALKLQMFRFQYKYNSIYQNYCKSLRISPDLVQESRDIPFLPITAFKYHDVKTGDFDETMVFGSSGTTGINRSFHYVRDLQHYIDNTVQLWQHYFDSVEQYCFLALLPGYLEREGSSLISMISHFIKISKHTNKVVFTSEIMMSYLKSYLNANKMRFQRYFLVFRTHYWTFQKSILSPTLI
jgi:hypothetical protein